MFEEMLALMNLLEKEIPNDSILRWYHMKYLLNELTAQQGVHWTGLTAADKKTIEQMIESALIKAVA